MIEISQAKTEKDLDKANQLNWEYLSWCVEESRNRLGEELDINELYSHSQANTLFKRWAQVMALRFSSGVWFSSCRLFPRRAVVTRVLCLLFGANTPWNRVRLTRGFGTSEASFAMKSNDSIITCVVPSL